MEGRHYLHFLPLLHPDHQCLLKKSLYVAGALVFTSGVPVLQLQSKGYPLDCLALVVKGACIVESHGTVAIRKMTLGRLPSPGPCADSD